MGQTSSSRRVGAPAIPKAPVFGWESFARDGTPDTPCIAELPHRAVTSSGRAAIYQALCQLDLAPGAGVLVSSYHCPTMVAPIVMAGLEAHFFEIRADGLPELASIPDATAQRVRAIIVTQYFGLAQSLHEVRAWCDARGISLIEDCAHCYFGQAGSRPVGAWGDYCAASLTKFYPLPEGGVLASAHHPLRPLALTGQGLRAEVKGFVDLFEVASQFGRVPGLNRLLRQLTRLKGGHAGGSDAAARSANAAPDAWQPSDPLPECDMGRINQRALWVSRKLWQNLPDGRIRSRRRAHFALYAELLAGLPDQGELDALPRQPEAPYVYPVWVENADPIYHGLRALGVPVFRWDRIWPGTPHEQHVRGRRWSRHLLQFLCHQDLHDADIRYAVQCLKSLLAEHATASKEPI